MRGRRDGVRLVGVAVVLAGLLGGCSSLDGDGSVRGGLGDLGSSIGGGIGRNNDTFGTNRRVDVYGASTAPSLPTIGAPGFGK